LCSGLLVSWGRRGGVVEGLERRFLVAVEVAALALLRRLGEFSVRNPRRRVGRIIDIFLVAILVILGLSIDPVSARVRG